jgi:hypothetical protein
MSSKRPYKLAFGFDRIRSFATLGAALKALRAIPHSGATSYTITLEGERLFAGWH